MNEGVKGILRPFFLSWNFFIKHGENSFFSLSSPGACSRERGTRTKGLSRGVCLRAGLYAAQQWRRRTPGDSLTLEGLGSIQSGQQKAGN